MHSIQWGTVGTIAIGVVVGLFAAGLVARIL